MKENFVQEVHLSAGKSDLARPIWKIGFKKKFGFTHPRIVRKQKEKILRKSRCRTNYKGDLNSEKFHFASNLQKEGAKTILDTIQYPPKEKILRVLIWHLLEIWASPWLTYLFFKKHSWKFFHLIVVQEVDINCLLIFIFLSDYPVIFFNEIWKTRNTRFCWKKFQGLCILPRDFTKTLETI